jgi:hypothetical protein
MKGTSLESEQIAFSVSDFAFAQSNAKTLHENNTKIKITILDILTPLS